MFMDGGGPMHPNDGPPHTSEYISSEITVAAINQMEEDYIAKKNALLQDLLDDSDSDKSPCGPPKSGPPASEVNLITSKPNLQLSPLISPRSPISPSLHFVGGGGNDSCGGDIPHFFGISPVHKKDVMFVPNNSSKSGTSSKDVSTASKQPFSSSSSHSQCTNSISLSSIKNRDITFVDSNLHAISSTTTSGATCIAVGAADARTGNTSSSLTTADTMLHSLSTADTMFNTWQQQSLDQGGTTPVIEIISPVEEGRG